MYKDKNKEREVNRVSVRKYRQKKKKEFEDMKNRIIELEAIAHQQIR